jgi:hypothetical protein
MIFSFYEPVWICSGCALVALWLAVVKPVLEVAAYVFVAGLQLTNTAPDDEPGLYACPAH